MATLNENGFLQYPGDYRQLLFYKKETILYDMTYWYQEHYLMRGDRTKDQMEQAARSGKQNVVEGKADGMTSKEMEIKLLNAARGSLLELMEDYQDQLRSRRLGTNTYPSGRQRTDDILEDCGANIPCGRRSERKDVRCPQKSQRILISAKIP